MKRLVDRRRMMDASNKQPSVVNVAIARELTCWCWAVGRMAEEDQRTRRRHSRVSPGLPELDGRWLPIADLFVRRRSRHVCQKIDKPTRRDSRSNEMHQRFMRDGRISNCRTGVEPDTRCQTGVPAKLDRAKGEINCP